MLKHLSKWNFIVVALLSLSVLLAACGDDTATAPAGTTPGATTAAASNGLTAPTGAKTTLAANYPDSTTVYISINTDTASSQIKSWQKIIDYLAQIPEVKMVTQNMDLLALAQIGTYDGDIKPWIGGELDLGLTDVNAVVNLVAGSTSSGSAAPVSGQVVKGTPGAGSTASADTTAAGSGTGMSTASGELPVLIGATVKDQTAADAFINKIGTKLTGAGLTAPTKETYKDATLYTFNLGVANLVAGLSKDKLFIGGGPALVKAAFDQDAAKSLSAKADFKTVLGKLPTESLTFAYLDYQTIVKTITNNPQVKSALASLNTTNLDYTGSVGLAFSTAAEGFRIDSYQTLLPDKTPPAIAAMLKKGANPNKVLNALPESTIAFLNSRDAASNYDFFVQTIKSASGNTGANFDKGIAQFEQQSGLSVKNDIVSLFAGEFGIFVTPEPNNKAVPVGFGLVTEATDAAGTQAKLDKISNAIAQNAQGKVTWNSKTVGSTTFKSATITDSNTTVTANIGIAGGYAFFAVGDDTTASLITAATGGKNFANGANSANFNKVKANLPSDNTGYIYLDIQSAIKLATANLPAGQQANQVKAVTDKLTKLYSIGASGHQTASETQSVVYIYFPVTQ